MNLYSLIVVLLYEYEVVHPKKYTQYPLHIQLKDIISLKIKPNNSFIIECTLQQSLLVEEIEVYGDAFNRVYTLLLTHVWH